MALVGAVGWGRFRWTRRRGGTLGARVARFDRVARGVVPRRAVLARGLRIAGGGSWPACQRAKICSRRVKMRTRAAMMSAWIASGIQAHVSFRACAVSRRQANLSPREEGLFSMQCILTDGFWMDKEKM